MDIIKKTLAEEISHKSQFAKECKEKGDLENASYWTPYVDGVQFSLDTVHHLTSHSNKAAGNMKTVKPLNFEGHTMSFMQIFGKGPIFHVTCGNCRGSFSQRIPMIDEPGLQCPHCGIINILPLVVERHLTSG